jgi:tetratricopeptide (TPR) repeat protein
VPGNCRENINPEDTPPNSLNTSFDYNSINQRQYEKAIDHATRAITLDPNDADNNSVMALTLIYSGRPNEAIDFTERMRRIDPACLF